MTQDTNKTILLSAGGTGGHLYPAEALAAELLSRGYTVAIVTDKRGHAFKSLGDRVNIYTVRAATLRPGLVSKIRAVLDMGIGVLSALRLVSKLKPALVVGFGGYPSFPGVLAAQILGKPTILHEQNAVLGKANVLLAPRARKIALSLAGTRGLSPAQQAKTVVTGNPVRAPIMAVRDIPYQPPADVFKILITGGSQAASVFADVVPEALKDLPENIKSQLYVMHQCRENDLAATAKKYADMGIKAETASFFSDMAERLASCQLFIGRSGASSVAELAVAGRPAIFVPYPGHQDMQQKHNADIIAQAGGAWVFLQPDFTPAALAEKIRAFAENPALLSHAAAAAATCGQTGATAKLADLAGEQAAAS